MKLDRVQERIKSRLSGGLTVDINSPDLELKIKIIKKRLNDIQSQFRESYDISEDVKIRIALTNIFDNHYRTFASGISAPGRSFQIGLYLKL